MFTSPFIVVLFTFFVITGYSYDKSGYFDVMTVRSGADFSFPIFNLSQSRFVETKINRLLQLSEIQGLARGTSPNIFSRVKIDDGTIYGGKTTLIATIHSNNARILSIGFDESSCGMTCAYWHRYHNFNPGNGDRIELEDLFDKKAYEVFRKLVFAKRESAYRKDALRNVPITERQYMLDQAVLLEDDDLSDFYVRKSFLIIDGENFLSKNNKFFGLNMHVRFHLSEFEDLLNDYGKTVFGLSNKSVRNYRSKSFPQLYEGKISDKWPIAMVMDTDGITQASGVYAYLRYGIGIDLQGSVNERGEFVFNEHQLIKTRPEVQWLHAGEYRENGTMKFRQVKEQLIGTWTNKDQSSTFPFIAKR